MSRFLFVIMACCFLGVLPHEAFAHRVHAFAWIEGGQVMVDAYYSRSSRVNGGKVEIVDTASGAVLATGTTDAEGRAVFAVPMEHGGQGLTIVVDAGAGHRAEWSIAPEELAAGDRAEAAVPATAEPALGAESGAPAAAKPPQAPVPPDDGPGLRDVVGGLGWIVGIFGIAAWLDARRRFARKKE
ncbi:hypothetical protein dsat_1371 [Alkalidesulfovibrio alkalitolerans DSM 16529]|jgi:nickel transport protein|uniref:Nickel transport protein n=1 Tax=Alkalidesulfovibrio alkalitolerans DSM 16529 TaxID=1121439 RepID=S7U9N9_9BACT|nr:hypothetical protein [Alkalidesulfovibrio alkalitolerans]EPR30649.1 hypothetical protein dsat_1371 [Alkalidesulfovibrio alkalitolerans DSM 16529]